MKNETELHLNADGNIDTAYYIRQAHQLRSDYMTASLKRLMNKFKPLFPIQLPRFVPNRTPQH